MCAISLEVTSTKVCLPFYTEWRKKSQWRRCLAHFGSYSSKFNSISQSSSLKPLLHALSNQQCMVITTHGFPSYPSRHMMWPASSLRWESGCSLSYIKTKDVGQLWFSRGFSWLLIYSYLKSLSNGAMCSWLMIFSMEWSQDPSIIILLLSLTTLIAWFGSSA